MVCSDDIPSQAFLPAANHALALRHFVYLFDEYVIVAIITRYFLATVSDNECMPND